MLLTVMSLLAVVCSGDEVGEANAQTTGAQTKTQNIAETPATLDSRCPPVTSTSTDSPAT